MRRRPPGWLAAGSTVLLTLAVLSRNMQVLVEYFNGRSFDGQFYRDPVEYVGFGVHFNF